MKSLCESSVFFHASWKDVFLDIYSRPIAFAKFPSIGKEISFPMGSHSTESVAAAHGRYQKLPIRNTTLGSGDGVCINGERPFERVATAFSPGLTRCCTRLPLA